MIRGLIYDNLEEKNIFTKKCQTEEAAKIESKIVIGKLCKKFQISVKDERFILVAIELKKWKAV